LVHEARRRCIATTGLWRVLGHQALNDPMASALLPLR
jgi:hypothetical protein